MNKSFLIAWLTFITSAILIGLLMNNAIDGLAIGVMTGLITFIFFEFIYYKKKSEC